MLWFKRLIMLLTLPILAACSDLSVTPLTATGNLSLAQVNVVDTSGRLGQLYARQLRQKLHVNGQTTPEYDLISSITTSSSSTLSVRGTSSTLKKMNMSASIQLIDIKNGDIVLKETLSAGATLGAVSSYFGQDESEANAKARLSQLLATRVAQRVQLYFIKQDK